MLSNRVLIVVNSVYQLITAIHMKRTILAQRKADLLLTDMLPNGEAYLPHLQEIRLFDRVIFARTREWIQKCSSGKKEDISELFQNIYQKFQWGLSDELSLYCEVYFSNFDAFTRMLASAFYAVSCEFICYEDGFSSYVIDFLREDRSPINRHPEGRKIKDKITKVLLYEPHLAVRKDELKNCPLPKINRGDTAFKAILNHVFDYQSPEQTADFIFLEQSFRAEGLKTNDISLMETCQKIVGPGRFFVKPHPRNSENVAFQMGLTRKYTERIPWELFLLNEGLESKTILTVCSSAALTSRIVFGMDVNTVMLYQLFEGKVLWKEDDILKKYLRKFQRQFSGKNYYVPQTVYELANTLHYLGGHYAS